MEVTQHVVFYESTCVYKEASTEQQADKSQDHVGPSSQLLEDLLYWSPADREEEENADQNGAL